VGGEVDPGLAGLPLLRPVHGSLQDGPAVRLYQTGAQCSELIS
jgi:hypothetical protein